MENSSVWWSMIVGVVVGTLVLVFCLLKNINQWYCVSRLGERQKFLPPGSMGWPLIGNMLSFLKAFKSQDPESFVNHLIKRYGRTGIYKTHLFWRPTIIVCSPETCKRVLLDSETFAGAYSSSLNKLAGKASIQHASAPEHRHVRKLVAPSISGQEALSTYVGYVEEIVIVTLEKWANMNKPIEVIEETRKLAFKVITTIFFGSISDSTVESLFKVYQDYARGFRYAMNKIPLALDRALKAKAELKKMLGAEVEQIVKTKKRSGSSRRGMVQQLMEAEDKQGEKLEDDYILDLLVLYLFAGQESTALAMVWCIINLHNNPNTLQIAKEEQEAIIKTRPSSQKGLTLLEIKEMKYMKKVIDETLRISNPCFAKFREARTDVSINGYLIPKGWQVLAWSRAVHLDPEIYPNPKEFLPSRWDEVVPRVGSYNAFSAGSMTCRGADLAQTNISIFIHYFILNYKLEQLNPRGPVKYLPTRPADNCLAKIIKSA